MDKSLIIALLDEKQVEEITVLDFNQKSSEFDYMIVGHVSNPRLLEAVANYTLDYLEVNGLNVNHVEGKASSGWILIDSGNIIIHLFLEETRRQYSLEKLWQEYVI